MGSLSKFVTTRVKGVIARSTCTGEIPKKIKNEIFIRCLRSAIFFMPAEKVVTNGANFFIRFIGISLTGATRFNGSWRVNLWNVCLRCKSHGVGMWIVVPTFSVMLKKQISVMLKKQIGARSAPLLMIAKVINRVWRLTDPIWQIGPGMTAHPHRLQLPWPHTFCD